MRRAVPPGGLMSDHVREQHSVLAAGEKRLLITIANRLPPAVTSDHLTLLAFASMCLAAVGYGLAYDHRGWLWVPVGALALNWFGDSLDGTLARVRRLERPRFGFYVDHVVDIVGIYRPDEWPRGVRFHEPGRRAGVARRLPAGVGRGVSRHQRA